jgi:hypothetical protein
VDLRCPNCGRLLARHRPSPAAYLEIKCRTCKWLVVVAGLEIRGVVAGARGRGVDSIPPML